MRRGADRAAVPARRGRRAGRRRRGRDGPVRRRGSPAGLDPGYGSTAHVARLLGRARGARGGRGPGRPFGRRAGLRVRRLRPAHPAGRRDLEPGRVGPARAAAAGRPGRGSACPSTARSRRNDGIVTPSRHLGLVPAAEREATGAPGHAARWATWSPPTATSTPCSRWPSEHPRVRSARLGPAGSRVPQPAAGDGRRPPRSR